jgi:hypothetical protein
MMAARPPRASVAEEVYPHRVKRLRGRSFGKARVGVATLRLSDFLHSL